MTQFALDFTGKMPADVQQRIQDGMQRADQNANPAWRHIFDGCVLAAARKKAEITSDDVLVEIESLPCPPQTHNLAAIGPAMKRAAQMGVLARTDRFCRSQVKHKNGNLHNIWQSKVFKPQCRSFNATHVALVDDASDSECRIVDRSSGTQV